LGGLSKKAFQIKKITAERNLPSLFVDSGNLLFKRAPVADGPSQEQVTAAGIIKIYDTMKVDAVAVGPLDLAAGTAFLQASKKQGFPWLSANLLDQQGRPLFEPVRIKKIGKIQAGIIGLTGAVVAPLPAGISRGDWRTLLPPLIKKTAPKCDILILLSSLTPAENQEIAQQFPAIHLILAANQDSGNMNPQQVNNTLITKIGSQGKYQGILQINWNKSGKWGKAKEEELSELRNRLGALDWQIQRMQQKQEGQPPEYSQKTEQTEQDRKDITQQIKILEQGPVPGSSENKNAPCSFTFEFLALKSSLPDAPEIKAQVVDIKRQIDLLNQQKTSSQASQASQANAHAQSTVLGHQACRECHPAQTTFWQTTRHARAYQTLHDKGQARNQECLPCHVTISPGLTLAKERLLALPPTMLVVGCENCHVGQGRAHPANPQQAPMTKQVKAEICLSCHTPARDKHFDYQKKKGLIACPAK
jgi:hypothetical protein